MIIGMEYPSGKINPRNYSPGPAREEGTDLVKIPGAAAISPRSG